MSTETIKLLARYNSHANQEMGRVLAELTVEEWNKPLGGYFPSIRSLVSHIFSSDLAYLKRFAALRTFAYVDHPLFARTIAKGEVLFPAFSDYEPDRKALDALFTRLAGEVTPADLAKPLRFTNYQRSGVALPRHSGQEERLQRHRPADLATDAFHPSSQAPMRSGMGIALLRADVTNTYIGPTKGAQGWAAGLARGRAPRQGRRGGHRHARHHCPICGQDLGHRSADKPP